MVDRWHNRAEPGPGEGTVYWHMLMRNHPQVANLAAQAQQRLAPYAAGLHMTPREWLHMTTLIAGPAASFTDDQLRQMTSEAAKLLADIPPVTVTLGRILYHPEAIMLGVTPAAALLPIRDAACKATQLVTGNQEPGADAPPWIPHITICYSTSEQPARPLIDALGLHLPSRDIQISALSLVIQRGPERRWDWTIVSTIYLDDHARGPSLIRTEIL